MKRILTSFAIVAASLAFAQVSIAPSEVTPKATLDIEAIGGNTADGILIPRVDRARAQAMTSVEKSTLIYVNSIANGAQTGQTVDVDAEGFYYFDGTKWVKLGSSSSNEGKLIKNVVVTDSNYTIGNNDYFVKIEGGGDVTVSFPVGSEETGRQICIFNASTGDVTMSPGGQFTLGSSPNPLTANFNGCFIYDGSTWTSISNY